jgi:hypothetical protein
MRTKLSVAAALGGTLIATCLVSGSAQATSLSVLKGDATPGIVTLVGKGRGGSMSRGSMSRGSMSRGSMSRGSISRGSISRGSISRGSISRGDGRMKYGSVSRGDGRMKYGSVSRGDGRMKYGSVSRGKDRDYKRGDVFKDGRKKHYASKDRDRDRDRFKRHRVWRNGAWVWVYGPGYTAYGDDCYWLRRQAIITGSPYWWRRYNLCIGYDYY